MPVTLAMLRLFYFSGTGNARNVAHWIASAWRDGGRDVDVADLAAVNPRAVRLGADDEVGFASPTHGFNFPPITLRFILAFPEAPRANRAFIVNTRAGLRLFGVYVPGLSGVAQVLAALVLLAKGYRVVGMRPIDLPSSWISLHPGLGEDNIRAIYERCSVITRRFATRLLEGRRDLRALWDMPQDLLVAPLSLGYYFVGRFFFAKSFIASSACDDCGVCIGQCPTGALTRVHGRPFWTWRCESCMRCMNQCPRRAIETAHGFVVAVPLLFSLAMSALVVPAAAPLTEWMPAGRLGRFVRFVFDTAATLGVLLLGYRLMHRALCLRWMQRLVVATSLTHFAFWKRYRAPRVSVPGAR